VRPRVPAWVGTLAAAALVGCASPTVTPPPTGNLHDMPVQNITGEETWEGRVLVDRIVVVRAGGHLRVAPGTQVLFRRVDWDADGIGDAELTVEGRLTAVGTSEAPILFASAEAEPRAADWKYLMVNFSPGANLAYARVAHAFSGIQVHYSPARVARCEFTGNVDGVRFSTARLRVEECWIHHNTHGVRFEERGHPAEVVGNEISDNGVGIFAVTECRGRPLFQGNNLRRNGTPVKMGWEQRADLAFPDNYWGAADEGAVLSQSLDGRKDPALGRVALAPMLPLPAPVPLPPFAVPRDWPAEERH